MKLKRLTTLTAATPAVSALALTGCSPADQQGAGGGGDGVAAGASIEEYQAALADPEPITLTFQTPTPSAASHSAKREEAWAAAINEYSGGKITMEIVYGSAIAPPNEIANALRDGRLDLAHWSTTYHANEMKAFTDMQSALVSIPASPVVGEIVTHFAAQEVAFSSPEVMAEFDAQGMTVLNPYNPIGATMLACAEPHAALADFQGDQIRANAQAQTNQIHALGGTMVTMQLNETYEGLQRGVLQCTMGSAATLVSASWAETAPNIYLPQTSSFVTGPGSIVAGASWANLPLAAQRVIFDTMKIYNMGELGQAAISMNDVIAQAAEYGGGVHYLDPESDAKIAEGNQTLIDAVNSSANLDGAALVSSVEESAQKWTDIAAELGYTDEGDFLTFPEWYQGNGEVMDDAYWGPIADRFYDEVLSKYRPGADAAA